MKKLALIIAVALLIGIIATPIQAGPKLFSHNNRTFYFRPCAFYYSIDLKPDNHHYFTMKNVTGKEQKFSGVIHNLGPSIPEDDWEIVQYCFSDACYPPEIVGTTGGEIPNGIDEDCTAQFSPHATKSKGKFGNFGTAAVDVWPVSDKAAKDTMYIVSYFIPFTIAEMVQDNAKLEVKKCNTWDPLNKDKTKRYPLTSEEFTLKVPPVNLKGSMYLPFRDMGEKVLGAKVEWDAKTRTAMYVIGDIDKTFFKISLPIDKPTATLEARLGNGMKMKDVITLKKPATIYKGSTVVPLRGVVELFGGGVEYDAATRGVKIYLPAPVSEEE